MKFTAEQIAEVLDGNIDGNPDITVSGLAKIEEGAIGKLTFLSKPEYESYIYSTEASIVIVDADFTPKEELKPTLIRVASAREAFAKLLTFYDASRPQRSGKEEPYFINDSAQIGKNHYIGAFSYVAENVVIGKNVKIYPHVYIGENVVIGDNCTFYSGVKIYSETEIGHNCMIHANSVIGSDGFGFVPDEKMNYAKIPQIGNVIIEDDVEIGAGCTIDRATLGHTIIRKGVKLDNQLQVGHNVEVGRNTVIASQTGIAGSTKIGERCIIGGQVGFAGHLKFGNDMRVQAQSGVSKNFKDGTAIQGSFAFEYTDWFKSYAMFKNLPRLNERIKELEKKLNELNNG
jgi:UDP-3-O-[3-hydroxymyristoyl] glucosamine N-acyltransferase